MKTDKYNSLRIGDRYNDGEYLLDIHADIQTIKGILQELLLCYPDGTIVYRETVKDLLKKLEEQ